MPFRNPMAATAGGRCISHDAKNVTTPLNLLRTYGETKSMKVALIGLPGSGKSTVFAAVTGVAADPFAPPEPRQSLVKVPEPRLAYLVDLCKPKKVTETSIEIVDVPGCSLDDSRGRDEWRRLLPTLRQSDLLAVVLRDFDGAHDPAKEFATVWDELIFADLDTVTTRVDKLEQALKKPTKTHEAEKRELALLQRCGEALESGSPLSTVFHGDEERKQVSSFGFLTEKPVVCVRNVAEDKAAIAEPLSFEHVAASVVLGASIEAEIAQLDPEDRELFMADLGLEESAKGRLLQQCYRAGGLISFFTMGPDEVRAWTIHDGDTAVDAAARIHTDLARGFIRAETVAYDDLLAHTDMKGAKAAGKVRKEGKTYIVKDADVLLILSSA